jgi:hypothetical protein
MIKDAAPQSDSGDRRPIDAGFNTFSSYDVPPRDTENATHDRHVHKGPFGSK